jgi:HK97 family phage major capsid protein
VAHGISKIATVIDVPDEVLEDLEQARSYIDGRLTLFVQMEEEDQLLNGSGVAPNLLGLNATSGTQTKTVALTAAADVLLRANLDALYEAITLVRVVGMLEPDGVAIHPNDYQKFRLGKDGNNQYYGGGPFMGPYGQGSMVNDAPLWGLRTVVTSAVTEGVAWLGAFATGGTVFRKGGITVDATNSDGSKFLSNITTIRAEERVGLAILRPSAFVKVTFDWNPA